MGDAAGYFVRKATGLVRAWSAFDAFIYAFFSVNFVTLGMYIMSFGPFVPQGHLLPAAIITGIFVTFLVVVYGGLIATMPRAGGDYVWQSRVLGGGIAFVLAITGWWFILWYWTPVYATILNVEVLQPIAAVLKLHGLFDFLGRDSGLFAVCVLTALMAGFLVSL